MFHSSLRYLILYYCSFTAFIFAIRNFIWGGWQSAIIYEWLIGTLHVLLAYYMFILYCRMTYSEVKKEWVIYALCMEALVRLICVISMLAQSQPTNQDFCRHPYWLISAIIRFLL